MNHDIVFVCLMLSALDLCVTFNEYRNTAA